MGVKWSSGRALLGACAAIFLTAGSGRTADLATGPTPPPPNYAPFSSDSPWLFGGWGGYRQFLISKGIDFQLGYVSEIAYNATGGTRNLPRYTDQFFAGATFDLDKLMGIPNARFQATEVERNGRNLSMDARLNTLQLVQEVYGRGQTTRLVQFWYDQTFFNDVLDWKIGRMPFADDFNIFACDFQNLTFCGGNAGNILGNYIYNWPVSQWATRVKLNIKGFGYIMAGAFDANPNYLDLHGAALPVFYSGSTGVILPLEVGWLPAFGTYPGQYKIGAWYDTSTAPDIVTFTLSKLTNIAEVEKKGRYGAYLNFRQQVTHGSGTNPKSGFDVFLNAVIGDRRTSTQEWQIATGFYYTSPFAARPNDDVMLAVGATHVNDRVATAQAIQNRLGLGPVAIQHTEYLVEADYTWRPLASLLFRPNIQYIVDPGGVRGKSALVFGLKTGATF